MFCKQNPPLESIIGSDGWLIDVIKKSKLDVAIKILYLERAITLNCEEFIESLDLLDQNENRKFIQALKHVNDLYCNNYLCDSDGNRKPSLKYFIADLNESDIPALQDMIKQMITQRIARIKGKIDSDSLKNQFAKRIEKECSINPNISWHNKANKLSIARMRLLSFQLSHHHLRHLERDDPTIQMQETVLRLGEYGLTENMLLHWRPGPGNDSLQSRRPNKFDYRHKKLLCYLILKQGVQPEQALEEAQELSGENAAALKRLYPLGVRGIHVRGWVTKKNDNLSFFGYYSALNYLIRYIGLTPELAFKEIYQLSSGQVEVLESLYKCGLRGHHLRSWRPKYSSICPFGKEFIDASLSLMAEHHLPPEELIEQLTGLLDGQAVALYKLYPDGLRKKDLEVWQAPASDSQSPSFWSDHIETLIFLIVVKKLSSEQAINEINGLTHYEAKALRELWELDLRGDLLRDRKKEVRRYQDLDRSQAKLLIYLLREQHLSIKIAFQQLEDLSEQQAEILQELYPYGLRGKDLREWSWREGNNKFFDFAVSSALRSLIKEQGIEASESIQRVIGKSEWELKNLCKIDTSLEHQKTLSFRP